MALFYVNGMYVDVIIGRKMTMLNGSEGRR